MARTRTAKLASAATPATATAAETAATAETIAAGRTRKAPAHAAPTGLAPAAGSEHFTHFDASGQAHMVDVGAKAVTRRRARASGRIAMLPATLALIEAGTASKGDVLGVARIAAIQGAKRTSDLIPLCHSLPLTRVSVDFSIDRAGSSVTIDVVTETLSQTGVEMEALTAASIGLLTIYDMCKAVDRGMRIDAIRLLEKRGGKTDYRTADQGL